MTTWVDSHNHLASWSPDASQSYDELMEEAARRKLHGVAISDHYDLDCEMLDGTPWIFDPQAYVDTFFHRRRLPSKRQAGDPPGFLLGIELGWMPEAKEDLRRLLRDYPFDFAILSLHFFRGHDPYTHADAIYTANLRETYTEVIEVIADSAEAMPEAKIIGHYDFFSRYAPGKETKMLYEHAPEAFDRLFRAMVANGQALEINVGTVKSLMRRKGYSLEEAMPDPGVINRYRELGGRYFTLASDSHEAKGNGLYMPETVAYLEGLGVREFAWFEEGGLQML